MINVVNWSLLVPLKRSEHRLTVMTVQSAQLSFTKEDVQRLLDSTIRRKIMNNGSLIAIAS